MEFDLYQVILYLHHKLVNISTKIWLYSGDPRWGQDHWNWFVLDNFFSRKYLKKVSSPLLEKV